MEDSAAISVVRAEEVGGADGEGKASLWSVVSRKVHHVYVIRFALSAPYGGGEVRRRFRDFLAFRDALDPIAFGDLRLPPKAVAHTGQC